jgi:hypothetical protein
MVKVEFYLITTDKERWEHWGDGEGAMVLEKDGIGAYLIHEKQFTVEEFNSHVKKAFRESVDKLPNRLAVTTGLEPPEVEFKEVVRNMCKLFGYQYVRPGKKYNLEKEVYNQRHEPKVRIKNIL